MNTTVVFIALILLIVVGFTVFTAGLVTINNKVSKIWNAFNEFCEINKGLIDVNNTLVSTGKEGTKASLNLCKHIKDVIALNTKLIKIANDSLSHAVWTKVDRQSEDTI